MKRTLFFALIAAFLLAACGAKAMPKEEFVQVEPAYGVGGGAPAQEGYAPGTMDTVKSPNAIPANTTTRERMVIKNADLSIVVEDPRAALETITRMTTEMGGFVVSSYTYEIYTDNGNKVPEVNLTIRIPAKKLDEALKQIKSGAVEVQSENISGEDVTSQYVDLESQLKNLEAAEKQLMEIMENATETEDVLNTFNQLTAIRGQIESIKGQMKYFEESAALSAVSVRLVAEETVKPIEVGKWQIKGWASDAAQGLIDFLRGFTKFLVYLVIEVLPILLVIGLVFGVPIWLIARAVRKANRRRKAQQAPKEEK